MSIVVQALSDLSKSTPGSAPMAYFYWVRNPAESEKADPNQIANALLKQLSCITIKELVSQLVFHDFETRIYRAEADELEAGRLALLDFSRLMLEHFDRELGKLFIDALDECDVLRRHQLFRMLVDLLQEARNVVKVFVTSRGDIDIVQESHKFSNIRIATKENGDNIAQFVVHRHEWAIRKPVLLQCNVSLSLKHHITKFLIDGT